MSKRTRARAAKAKSSRRLVGTFYYPAKQEESHASARAALFSIGCRGDHAVLAIQNAAAENSALIAVPANMNGHQVVVLIERLPDGVHQLWVGLTEFLTDDPQQAEGDAHELQSAMGGVWRINEWTRQSGVAQ